MSVDVKIVCSDKKYMPAYAHDTDACMDLKAKIPEGSLMIPGHSVARISTGIKMAIPKEYGMDIFVRSSIGCRYCCQLANSVGIVDAGYRDDIFLFFHNFGDTAVEIQDGQRIAQFRLVKKHTVNLVCVEDNEEFRNDDRLGGFGSTGRM